MTRKPLKVLITGAAGTIGRVLRKHLSNRFELTLLDIVKMNLPNSLQIDVAKDHSAVREAMSGHDAVVHLTLDPNYEDACANEMGAKNLYQAAMETLPHPRVIVASSIHAVGGLLDWAKEPYRSIAKREFDKLRRMPDMITTDAPLYPNGTYGAVKAYIEILGRYYATQGLRVVVLRLGGVRDDDRMFDEDGYTSFWLSSRDCAQLVQRAVEAQHLPPFSVFFGISNNRYRVHDLSNAEKLLGYAPQDDAEIHFADHFTDK